MAPRWWISSRCSPHAPTHSKFIVNNLYPLPRSGLRGGRFAKEQPAASQFGFDVPFDKRFGCSQGASGVKVLQDLPNMSLGQNAVQRINP